MPLNLGRGHGPWWLLPASATVSWPYICAMSTWDPICLLVRADLTQARSFCLFVGCWENPDAENGLVNSRWFDGSDELKLSKYIPNLLVKLCAKFHLNPIWIGGFGDFFRRVLGAGCAKPDQTALDTWPGRHSGLADRVTQLGWLWICAWGAGGLAWPGWPLIPAMPGLCLCSFGFGSYHVLLLRFANHNISRNFSKSSNHRLLWALASFLSRLRAPQNVLY